jgi:hypothetical protein
VTPYNLVEFYRCSLSTYQEGIREAEFKKKAGRDVKKKGGTKNITKGRQVGRKRQKNEERERKRDKETEVDERSNQGRR